MNAAFMPYGALEAGESGTDGNGGEALLHPRTGRLKAAIVPLDILPTGANDRESGIGGRLSGIYG
jgi:hypothetical protein